MRRALLGILLVLATALPAHAVSLCTLTGRVVKPDGTACGNCNITFRTPANQTIGGVVIPKDQRNSYLTDADGYLPAGVQQIRRLKVDITIATSGVLFRQIPDTSSADIETLILDTSTIDPQTEITAFAGVLELDHGGTGSSGTWTASRCVRTNDAGTALEVAADDCGTGGGGSGDVTAVGDCTTGACFTAAGTGTAQVFKNATSGSVTLQTIAGALGTRTISLPAETGTVCTTGSVCSGYQASGSYQPLDATLTALAALDSSAGLLAQTAADTFAKRTLTAGSYLDVTNGDGAAGNPTVAFDPTEVDSVTWGAGSNFTWIFDVGVTDVGIDFATAGSGTIDFAAGTLRKNGTDIVAVSGTGLAARTASNTFTVRSVAEGLAIDVTNGDGVAGDPTVAFDPTELTGDRTWAAGGAASIAWTYDLSGTDVVVTYSSGNTSFSGTLQQAGVGVLTTATGQPLDATLTALAALNSTAGMVVETAADTFTKRSLGEGLAIDVTNADGSAGNPTVAFDPTELTGDRTWAAGGAASIAWTMDLSGTDVVVTYSSGNTSFSGTLQQAGVSVLTTATGQPLDADLTALAALSTTGLMARTAANTYTMRTLTEGNALDVTNGDGVSGNPTVAFDATEVGTTTWGSGGSLTWTFDVGATDVGFDASSVSGGTIDITAGALRNNGKDIPSLSSNGFPARTAANTWSARSVAEGTAIDVTNGDGVSGNPTVALDSTELEGTTWGGGASATWAWAFNTTGSADVTLTFSNNRLDVDADTLTIGNATGSTVDIDFQVLGADPSISGSAGALNVNGNSLILNSTSADGKLYGTTGSSNGLQLSGNTSTNASGEIVIDPDVTTVSGIVNLIDIFNGNTVTFDSNFSNVGGIRFASALKISTDTLGAFQGAFFLTFTPTVSASATNVARSTGAYLPFYVAPIFEVDNNTASLPPSLAVSYSTAVTHAPNLRRAVGGSAGTVTLTDSNAVLDQPALSTAGVTITNRRGLLFKTPSATSGTQTNAVALDVEDQTVGTLGAAVRSAMASGTGKWFLNATGTAVSRLGGSTIVGSTSATPSSTLHVTEPTVGNEVFRAESVATNDDPNYKIFQKRATAAASSTTTIDLSLTASSPTDAPCPSSSVCIVESRTVCHCTSGSSCTTHQGFANVSQMTVKNNGGTISLVGAVTTPMGNQIDGSSVTSAGTALTVSSPNARFSVVVPANFNHTCHVTWVVQSVGS